MTIKPWRVTGTRTIYQDPYVRMRGDECETADGRALGLFAILEYRDWVHVVAIDAEDHVILVRQYRHGLGAVSLELPGGMVDASDGGDLAFAASRELMEETGYRAPSLVHIQSVTPNSATHANRMHVFLAEGVVPGGAQKLEPGEAIEVVRLPIAEAVRLALTGGMVHAMHVAALLIALQATGRLKPALP